MVDVNDIFFQFPIFNLRKKKKLKKIKTHGNKDLQNFENIFSSTPITADEIVIKTKLNIKDVLQKITLLEIEGVIEKEIGKGYKLKDT